jgi:hypothetical protein
MRRYAHTPTASSSSPATRTPRETREHILEAEQGYAIVEKIGIAGVEAERLDPRRDRGV